MRLRMYRAVPIVAVLAGILGTPAGGAGKPSPDVGTFADTRGRMVGAASACEADLARRGEACARHVLDNWPGGLPAAARADAIRRFEESKATGAEQIRVSRMFSCPDVADLLREDSMWETCPVEP